MAIGAISFPQVKSSFTEFLDNHPAEGFYEWVNGALVEMRATRQHDDIADFIADHFKLCIREYSLDFVVKTTALVRTTTLDNKEQGRKPDVSVILRSQWEAERRSYAALTDPIQLAVEVTSTNWDDDYTAHRLNVSLLNPPFPPLLKGGLRGDFLRKLRRRVYLDKLDEYQRLGIVEYWIVDYLALGSRDFLGYPKQPAILIFQLDEQQHYQRQIFRGEQQIVSKTFPQLILTAQQILQA